MVLDLTRQLARRLAVRAQLLDRACDLDVVGLAGHLAGIQVDLTEAVARSADLVVRARLGAAARPGDLERAQANGALFEHRARLYPARDVALMRADMECWPGPRLRPWQDAYAAWADDNDACRRDLIAHLRSDGPLAARDLPDTCVRPWRSSGWTQGKNVMKLLELMEARGEVAVVGRESRERVWDLAERVHADHAPVPAPEAHLEWARRRLAALGIARPRALEADLEPYDVREVGVKARIAGVRGTWRVEESLLADLDDGWETARTAVLSPLDRLVFDRKRTLEIFEFDYQLEMYKPPAQRRWGYWAMPVLHADRLIGKIDATADRDAGVLHVDAVHADGAWDSGVTAAVHRDLAAMSAWLGLEVRLGPDVTPGR